MQVHQFHPTVSFGDATSNQILSLQRLLRNAGYRSVIFCEHPPLHFQGRTQLIARYGRYASPESVLLLHFSRGYSASVLDWLEQLSARRVLVYHNITPHTYFAGVNETVLEATRTGREQLDRLRTLTEAGWGDSAFNCQELAERGWTHLETLPIIFDPRRYAVSPDRKTMERWRDGINVLFVGRVSPNKRLEDLILTFHYLKRFVWPDARLLLVGSAYGMEPYLEFLQALVKRLNLPDVTFTGHVSTAQLAACYRCASTYLSMSEHEGFGVPLLESMHFGVPIIAYKAAAVPETLGGSGILVKDKDYAAVAELIALLAEDTYLRAQVTALQRKRLQVFMPNRVAGHLRELIRGLECE